MEVWDSRRACLKGQVQGQIFKMIPDVEWHLVIVNMSLKEASTRATHHYCPNYHLQTISVDPEHILPKVKGMIHLFIQNNCNYQNNS